MGLLLLTNSVLMEYGLERSIYFTYQAHHKEAEKRLSYDIELLKDIVYKLSNNWKIIHTLERNKRYEDLDDSEKENIIQEMNSFEGYLKNLTFIDTIDIISSTGDYLITKGEVISDFKLMSRPWIKSEYFEEKKDAIVTDVHKDFNTGKYAISIVQFIRSKYDESLLGAAILDIYLDDLIRNLDSDFYMGTLNTYIKINDNEYYSSDGVIDNIENHKNKYIVKLADILKNGTEIVFEFDNEEVVYAKEMREINRFRIIIFAVTGIVYILILILFAKVTFKPIIKSLDKLKVLLNNLEKNDFEFESKDEFAQLELISNSLTKSFDRKIQSLIYHDELTKLPNRKMLYKICNDLIKDNKEFALIFIDLNKFKYINDIFGHSIGDDLLVKFGNIMNEILGERGIITRYSGDEFIIIYHRYINNRELKEFFYKDILGRFKEPIIIKKNKKVMVEFSAGVATYPKGAKDIDDLINKSDFMMYSSKKSVDNVKLLFFNDAIYNKMINIEEIKELLKYSIDNNELILYYQPIIDKNKDVKKFEALIRWNSKQLGFISPLDFISYAEENGEIVRIGYWIIEEICIKFSELFKCKSAFQVSVNVSPIQLIEFDFAEKVKEITDKYNVNMKNLCFEITESVVIDENIIVYDNIHLLHRFGASIALDDFGTGYSSFSYLRKLNLDILKIDKSFIGDETKVDYSIIYNIRNIAHILNMEIVIEGVETEKQFEALSNIGCDYFQGYFFAKPMNFEEIYKYIL
ncbi:MAG: EAL domain-containing protein [Clostridium celatum]|nr:EAL domain-containing protein [Clostridium celatum]